MRMVLISLAILLVLVGIWIWFHFTKVEPYTTYFDESLVDLSHLILSEQWNNAASNMLDYNNRWKDIRNLWVYFINQNDIDNIDSSIKKLQVFINNKDKTMAQAELEHLRVLFTIILENECLSMENIM